MEPAVFICRNPDCPAGEYMWEVERDERGAAVDGPAAKRCRFCREPGHRMTDRERDEARV